MQLYVIVTGIPASGKSTIGRHVATALGLEMLDKDDILETMFEERGIGDAECRKRLSRAADEVLKERVLQSSGAVIASWWHHPASDADSGTSIEWLSSLQGTVIELYCICSARVAASRFRSRNRHEGHLDHLKTYVDLLEIFEENARFGPLDVGKLVEVDTEQPLDVATLVDKIVIASGVDNTLTRH